jgi:undecaprenyl-diphosphatase
MTLLDGVLLGLVQGLTEFLPVSSTGHLILVRELLGLGGAGGLAFDAALHTGTLIAVAFYFRKELRDFIKSAWRFFMRTPLSIEERDFCGAIIWGTVPALAFGLLLKDVIDSSSRNSVVVAIGLLVGSLLMWYAEKRATSNSQLVPKSLNQRIGFRIGIFQALALFPGISRSGSTISGGLLNGVSREHATRFAFILSFPILLGAGGASLISLLLDPSGMGSLTPLIAGLITALISGLVAIHFLIRYLKTHTLSVFVWYRVAVAILILSWVLY